MARSALLLATLASIAATPAYAQDDPVPLYRISRDALGDTIVEGIGATPLGILPVRAYKVVDFARQLGDAAIEREDASRGATLILINADAALLEGLRARGADLSSDPKAVAARQRLRAQMEGVASTNFPDTHLANLSHIGAVTMKHLPYATAVVGMDKALGYGIGRVMRALGPSIRRTVGLGREVQQILGNKSALASGLRYVGWRRLGARASLARKYVDDLVGQLIQASLDEIVKARLRALAGRALDDLYTEVMEADPARREQVARLMVTRTPQSYSSLLPAPVPVIVHPATVESPPPAPVAATPMPIPAIATPVDRVAPVAVVTDPVMRTIHADDTYSRGSRSSSTPTPRVELPAPPPEPLDPLSQPLRFHREFECAGTQGKAGCGCFDGREDCSLYR